MKTSLIITSLFLSFCVLICSQPLPSSYKLSWMFQVELQSAVTYSPTQTSVIYSSGNQTCFTFRQSLQQLQSAQKQLCLNESIFEINYSPQADRVYVVTNVNETAFSLYMYLVSDGMIQDQPHLLYTLQIKDQIIYYAVISISKQNKIAISIPNHFIVLSVSQQFKAQVQFQTKLTYQVVELQWHPQQQYTLFMAGYGQNQVFNLQTKQFTKFSDLPAKHMNIMLNGNIVLINPLQQVQQSSVVHVFVYSQGQLNFLQKYTDFLLYRPGLCSRQGNIMGLVRDLNELHIFQATVQETSQSLTNSVLQQQSERIKTTYMFQKVQVIEFVPGISDGSMSSDGNEIYLRAYYPVKKFTRCGDGNYQTNNKCQMCSDQCKTCHTSANICTSCNENHFVHNQKCISCASTFKGCTDCSSIRCQICNSTANFEVFPSREGICKCNSDAYSINQGNQCKKCTDTLQGCSQCENSQKCLKCDEDNFVLDTETNTCKEKSKSWIFYVGIGVGILVIIGAAVMIGYIMYKKKKVSKQNNQGYAKFNNEKNERQKSDSFIKSISSQKSDGKLPDIESNNKI